MKHRAAALSVAPLIVWAICLLAVVVLEWGHHRVALVPLGYLAPPDGRNYQEFHATTADPNGETLELEVVATPEGLSGRLHLYPENRPWGLSLPVTRPEQPGVEPRGAAIEGRTWPYIQPDSSVRVVNHGRGVAPTVYFHQAFDAKWHAAGVSKGFWRLSRTGAGGTWVLERAMPPGSLLAVRRYVRWTQMLMVAAALAAMPAVMRHDRRGRRRWRWSFYIPAGVLASIVAAGVVLHEIGVLVGAVLALGVAVIIAVERHRRKG